MCPTKVVQNITPKEKVVRNCRWVISKCLDAMPCVRVPKGKGHELEIKVESAFL